jgi:DNA modification methylase
MGELLTAGKAVFNELKNVCVWNKGNGGLGKFYRSQHEFVFVFKTGTARHINNFGMGGGGRYRTNVWDYPGLTGFGSSRDEELTMHPTVKPVALVADAIRDCSHRGDLVLDAFGGSGTTMLAADTCGRRARLIEADPLYCDTIIRRFEKATGQRARSPSALSDNDMIRGAAAQAAGRL